MAALGTILSTALIPTEAEANLSGIVSFTGIITPTALGANTNDYNPTGLSTSNVIRLSSTNTFDLTGITAQGSGITLILLNVGTNNIILKNNNAGSVAANRFQLTGDITLNGDDFIAIWYDTVSSRWRAIGKF